VWDGAKHPAHRETASAAIASAVVDGALRGRFTDGNVISSHVAHETLASSSASRRHSPSASSANPNVWGAETLKGVKTRIPR